MPKHRKQTKLQNHLIMKQITNDLAKLMIYTNGKQQLKHSLPRTMISEKHDVSVAVRKH